MKQVRPLVLGVLVLLVAGSPTPSTAQSFDVVADFGAPEGMQPFGGLIEASDGYYYGTTGGGGVGFGTIFRVDSNGEVETLFLFSGPDGSRPEGPLLQASNGSLYGTTRMGGPAGKGTIFRFNPAGAGTFTLLRSFSGSDGAEPRGGLVEGADGNLYGTTYTGGLSCATTTCGTIFKVTPSGAFSTVLKFNKANGANPVGGLAAAPDGRLFGTTSRGGTLDRGTVFALNLSGSITTLHSFNFTNGFSPYATLVRAADGSFYGSTYGGGTLAKGTLFRVTAAGALTVLHSFTGAEGSYPAAPLVQGADGAFYGAASMGGASDKGTIFKLTSGAVTRLRSLSPNDGINPSAALVPTGPTVFYGTAASAGPPGAAGTLFTINTAGAFTIVHAFKGSPVKPYSSLVEGSDGRLLGTTYAGGGFGRGTIYSIDLSGRVDLIHAFTGTDGGAPIGGVLESNTGELFVNTTTGGASLVGSVVRISAGGTPSTLVSLASASGYPAHGTLVEASDGNFYGTAYNGALGYGTIFRVTRAGAFSVVHRFTGADGRNPYAGLIVGPSGLLYGVTTGGGSFGVGVIYSFNPVSSDYRRLASFSNSTGASPRGNLVYAADGNLYGTTMNGGGGAVGTIFRFDPGSNAITNLYSFTNASGANPYAGLVQGSDAQFYGTTYAGGASNVGTVFKFNAATRQLTTLHSFNGSNGSYPHGALLLARDGAFYGTTTTGGSSDNGVVFKVSSGGGGGGGGTFEVNVTSPNGGEVLAKGVQTAVQWQASGATASIDSFDVQFSTDAGTTFSPVSGCTGLSASARSCNWVAGPATTRGRIRVIARDGAGTQVPDQSNANFTVGFITATAPGGAAVWAIGSTQQIKWSHNIGKGAAVKIELSRNGGASWETVAASVNNSGSSGGVYNWTVAGPVTAQGRIRVTSLSVPAITDVTNQNFTISQ